MKKPSEFKHSYIPSEPLDEGFSVFYELCDRAVWIDFVVIEVESEMEGQPGYGQGCSMDPDDGEVLLHGYLKWDGCMNVSAGSEQCGPMHFCRLEQAMVLGRAMEILYRLGAETIPGWDK